MKVAKNTVKLLKLCLPQLEVFIGENESDFIELASSLDISSTGVIYPSATSTAIETTKKKTLKCIVFIDGTWRKAYKILQLNPWLNEMPHFHFNQAPETQYNIRSTNKKNSLSTLEAVEYTLTQIGNSSHDNSLKNILSVFNKKYNSFRNNSH